MSILILVIGLLLIIGQIVIHEFGHFIVARRNGVEAEEFAIFFGPNLYKRKTKAGWMFRFNSLPLGGYVKLKGEHDSDTAKGSYGAASLWVKTKIMTAGVAINFVSGIVLLTIVALIGMPQIFPNQFGFKSNSHIVQNPSSVEIGQVEGASPASYAGLKSGDDITALGVKGDLIHLNSISGLQAATGKFAGQKVIIDYTRNNKSFQTSTTLNTTAVVRASANSKQPKAYLGVALDSSTGAIQIIRYTWAAPIVAVGTTKQAVVLTYQGLRQAVVGLGGIVAGTATNNHAARHNAQTTASNQLVGPYGIFEILKEYSSAGVQFMLFIVALIALALAMWNILPIPALDGGRLWLTLIFRALKKPLTARREEIINAVGMLALIGLVIVITYVDISRFH